ncbi:hypothetical protein J2Z70_003144 [Paenibacillus silagei]|uniref:Uncharacterized protein n=1 Tax=Paenibacillus silagei TaxID=1670801 RepID=A0ABS4NUA6_9BACL|nr:hypothetical protein [Paenibacillus silagei]
MPVFRIHSGHTPACQHNVCCFSHTFGPYACVPPQCMLFLAYIRAIRLHAEHNVCCFSHTFRPYACVRAQCMLFLAYIRVIRLRASTMNVVFGIHSGHTPACEHNECCFWHTFGSYACVRAQCMLFFAYIRAMRRVPLTCMLFLAYIRAMRLGASTMFVVFHIHSVWIL